MILIQVDDEQMHFPELFVTNQRPRKQKKKIAFVIYEANKPSASCTDLF